MMEQKNWSVRWKMMIEWRKNHYENDGNDEKIENIFLFKVFCLNSVSFVVVIVIFSYLVAKSLCTKFICSKYFIPEAICVAMYIKQP